MGRSNRFVPMTPHSLIQFIQSRRFPLGTEKETQAAIEAELRAEGHAFLREHRFSDEDIVDFFFPETGLAAEVKVKKGARAIHAQLERYCGHSEVRSIVLVTNAAMGLPASILGKPARMVSLGRGWL